MHVCITTNWFFKAEANTNKFNAFRAKIAAQGCAIVKREVINLLFSLSSSDQVGVIQAKAKLLTCLSGGVLSEVAKLLAT